MKYLKSFILIALFPLVALSMWRIIPLDSAVKESDLIVVGTLRSVREETRGEIDYGSGELMVEEVLRGKAEQGQKLSLAWENESGVICPRLEHRDHEGKQLLWLLKLKPDGKVAADNPGRFISVEKKAAVLELLRQRGKSNNGMQRTRN